jgi:hypothetical protein
MLKLERKFFLAKAPKKTIERIIIKLKKITYHKFGFKYKIENKSKFHKK